MRRTRRAAVVLACLMHAMILLVLIFSRLNTVVWPWNLAIMAMTVILFHRNHESTFEYLVRPDRGVVNYLPTATILICGLLPALSFIGWVGSISLKRALFRKITSCRYAH